MAERYTLAPGQSRFTVQAFATGLLSFMGHNPTFVVRTFAGEVRLAPGTAEELCVRINVCPDSLELADHVRPGDRREIEGRMRQEVLETAAYPEIGFQGSGLYIGKVTEDHLRFRIEGRLSLHGITQPLQADASLIFGGDKISLVGACLLPLPAFRIRPVTALGGAIKLKDQVRVAFDLVGVPAAEGS
jgi:polyisoprenoid-binding protein YceI